MFELGGCRFDVTRAALVPFADDHHVHWGVELAATGVAELADWQPELTIDRLVSTPMRTIRRWQEIAPASGRATEASLYVFEHHEVRDAVWTLRRDGRAVTLRLDGRVELDGAPLGRDTSIVIEVSLPIGPWPFGRVGEAECRAQYARTGLEHEVEFRDVGGVAHLVLRTA